MTKLFIDGVEQDVPAVAADLGMSIYVDHTGAVRATKTEAPPPPEQTADQKRIAELEAKLASQSPADNAGGPPANEN